MATNEELLKLDKVLSKRLGAGEASLLVQGMIASNVRTVEDSIRQYGQIKPSGDVQSARTGWWASEAIPARYKRLLDATIDPAEANLAEERYVIDMSNVYQQWNQEIGSFTKDNLAVFVRLWRELVRAKREVDRADGKQCNLPLELPDTDKGMYWLSVAIGADHGLHDVHSRNVIAMLKSLTEALADGDVRMTAIFSPEWQEDVNKAYAAQFKSTGGIDE